MPDVVITVPPDIALLLIVGGFSYLLFQTVCLQMIFNKSYESGWKAWVPFLNAWTFFTSARMSGWWILSLLVPILGVIMLYVAAHKIGEYLGFGGGMTFLAIFIPSLWLLVMAISRNKTEEEIAAKYAIADPQIRIQQSHQAEGTGRDWALAGTGVAPTPTVQTYHQQPIAQPTSGTPPWALQQQERQ